MTSEPQRHSLMYQSIPKVPAPFHTHKCNKGVENDKYNTSKKGNTRLTLSHSLKESVEENINNYITSYLLQ